MCSPFARPDAHELAIVAFCEKKPLKLCKKSERDLLYDWDGAAAPPALPAPPRPPAALPPPQPPFAAERSPASRRPDASAAFAVCHTKLFGAAKRQVTEGPQ